MELTIHNNPLVRKGKERIDRGPTLDFLDLPLRIQAVALSVAKHFSPNEVRVHGSYWHGFWDEATSDLDLWIAEFNREIDEEIINSLSEQYKIKLDVCNGNNAIKADLGVKVPYE